MSDAKEFFAAVLNDEGRIAADVFCVSCRYNLRALSAEGACPECGAAIFDTKRLRFSAPAWVRRLKWGVLLLTLTFFVQVGACLVQSGLTQRMPMTIGTTVQHSRAPEYVNVAAMAVAGVSCFAGLWLLTTRDPTDANATGPVVPRRLIRWVIWAIPVTVVSTVWSIVLPRQFVSAQIWLAITVVLVCACPTLLLLSLQQMSILLRRIPNRWLVGYSRITLWIGAPLLAANTALVLTLTLTSPTQIPSPPYAVPVPAGTSISASGPTPVTATEYFIIGADNTVTRATTVPASIPVVTSSTRSAFEMASSELCNFSLYPTAAYVIGLVVLLFLTWRAFAKATHEALAWRHSRRPAKIEGTPDLN